MLLLQNKVIIFSLTALINNSDTGDNGTKIARKILLSKK